MYETYFFPAEEYLKIASLYIKKNENVLIKAPRRFGKSSLLCELIKREKNTILINVKNNFSLELLINRILNLFTIKFTSIESIDIDFLKILNYFSNNEDLLMVNKTTELLSKQKISDNFSFFIYTLEWLNIFAVHRNIHIKLFFDGIEDLIYLIDLKDMKYLKNSISNHTNLIYIFTSYKNDFFNMKNIITINKLDIEAITEFISKDLREKKVEIIADIKKVYSILEGHPFYSYKYTKVLYQHIFRDNVKILTNEIFENVLNELFFEYKSYLDEVLEKIKKKRHHHSVLFHLARVSKNKNIDSVTLYKTKKSLEDLGYLEKSGIHYHITDPFLRLLLLQDDLTLLNKKLEGIIW